LFSLDSCLVRLFFLSLCVTSQVLVVTKCNDPLAVGHISKLQTYVLDTPVHTDAITDIRCVWQACWSEGFRCYCVGNYWRYRRKL